MIKKKTRGRPPSKAKASDGKEIQAAVEAQAVEVQEDASPFSVESAAGSVAVKGAVKTAVKTVEEQIDEAEPAMLKAQAVPAPVLVPIEGVASDEEEDDADSQANFVPRPQHGQRPPQQNRQAKESSLTVRLSAALVDKLRYSAQDEGISLDAFISELLAEGVVLRAWEIVERKNAMRGGQSQQGQNNFRPQQGGQNRHNNNRGGHNNNNNRNGNGPNNNNRRPQQQNNAWMEDKAAFLEYVRNQEKRRR